MKHKFDKQIFKQQKKREKEIREAPDRIKAVWDEDHQGKPPWAKKGKK